MSSCGPAETVYSAALLEVRLLPQRGHFRRLYLWPITVDPVAPLAEMRDAQVGAWHARRRPHGQARGSSQPTGSGNERSSVREGARQ
jgi:hypothetical protein